MYFDQAQEEMSKGNKVKLSDWIGYWFNDNGQIKVFTKNGDVLDTPNIDRYKDRDDWEVTDGKMGFDFALLALLNGKKLQRTGWNGNGMVLEVQKPDEGSKMTHQYLFMSIPGCEEGLRKLPWQPAQVDIFAKDWRVVD